MKLNNKKRNTMDAKEDLIHLWKDDIKNKNILKAFQQVKREDFVLDKAYAYDDTAQPYLEGQTISQPTTIFLMLDWLEVKSTHKVLEIGAGSGYNAALLSKLAKKVYTIETNKKLADTAKENLKNFSNVTVIHGDGAIGYEKEAPYDRIISTCASPKLFQAWIDQLKDRGIIVAPIGKDEQIMNVVKKQKNKLDVQEKGRFSFVPLRTRL